MESSQSQGKSPVINDGCNICLSESSSTVVTTSGNCLHKFCVKCFLGLWSSQEDREPCTCPIDGVKMRWICPAKDFKDVEIGSLVLIYNRLFRPHIPIPKDLAKKQFASKMTWLYGLEGAICIAGLIAYCIKAK